MFVSFTESSDRRKEKTDVVFNACLKPLMSCLLEVITGSRIFNQSKINIILSAFLKYPSF